MVTENTVRKNRRKDQIFAEARERHREAVVSRWLEAAPSRTVGFNVDQDLVKDKWNDRIKAGAVRSLHKYLNEPTQFLILKGSVGLGKSTLAVTLTTDLLSREPDKYTSAVYSSTPLLLQEFSFPDADRESPVSRSIRTPILLLDDVGASNESITPHQQKTLWSVIDSRWGARDKLTIMTTNMSVTSTSEGQGLIDWFGESAWDRIKDDLTLIDFQGESMRGNNS